jgi:anti-sigma B factor antagonist
MEDMSGTTARPDEGFRMTERREGETVILTLIGELDLASVGGVQQRLGELRDAGSPVILDLDQLTFMDSTGIRMLVSACQDADEHGWTFKVTRGSGRVRHLLSVVQIADRLPYADGAPM